MTLMKFSEVLFSALQIIRSLLDHTLIFERRSKDRRHTGRRWNILLLVVIIPMSITVEGSMLDFLKTGTRKISTASGKKGSIAETARPIIHHRPPREFNYEKPSHVVSPQESGIGKIDQIDTKEWKSVESQREMSAQGRPSINSVSRPPKYPKKLQKSVPLPLPKGPNKVTSPTQQSDLRDTSRTLDEKHGPVDEPAGAELRDVENPQDLDFSFPIWHSEKQHETLGPKFWYSNKQREKGYWEYPNSSA